MKKLISSFFVLLILFVSATPASAWCWFWCRPALVIYSIAPTNGQLDKSIKANTSKIAINSGNISPYSGLKSRVVALENKYSMTTADITKISQNIGTFYSEIGALQAQLTELANKPDASTASSEYNIPVMAAGDFIGMAKTIESGGDYVLLQFNKLFEPAELLSDGKINDAGFPPLSFKNADCQGDIYVGAFSFGYAGSFNVKPAKGKVFGCHHADCASPLYYYPPQEDFLYQMSAKSYLTNNGCANVANSNQGYYFKVTPNNPTVTGINIYPFPTPIERVGFEPITIIPLN